MLALTTSLAAIGFALLGIGWTLLKIHKALEKISRQQENYRYDIIESVYQSVLLKLKRVCPHGAPWDECDICG